MDGTARLVGILAMALIAGDVCADGWQLRDGRFPGATTVIALSPEQVVRLDYIAKCHKDNTRTPYVFHLTPDQSRLSSAKQGFRRRASPSSTVPKAPSPSTCRQTFWSALPHERPKFRINWCHRTSCCERMSTKSSAGSQTPSKRQARLRWWRESVWTARARAGPLLADSRRAAQDVPFRPRAVLRTCTAATPRLCGWFRVSPSR